MKKTIVLLGLFFMCSQILLASITVDGFCYLENATNHSGTKVLFHAVSASANTDSTYTNADGSFLIGLSEGIYTVHYSHDGWQSYTIPGEISFFVDTTLDNVTLSSGLVEEVSGPQSGIWTSDYIYQVIGDISVNIGDTLIIEQGVTVKFMDYYSFTIYGKLVAAGTETDTIRFTSGQPTGNPEDWNHIQFNGISASNSVISYAKIENAYSGIYCAYYSSPTISNNTITNNNCGISCRFSSPTISNNTISNNNGGIYCSYSSSPTISNNTICNNNDDGIHLMRDCSPTISNNTISNNNDVGIYCASSIPAISTISNNTINNNNCGIYCRDSSSPTILNNILYDNVTGIDALSSPSSLEYNLFWLNSNAGSGNMPATFGEIVTVNANGDSCDTYFNLFIDPLFVDTLYYHLTENSPCIDAGNPDSIYYDPDGTISDMGAFYFDQGSPAPIINDFTAVPTEGTAPLVVQFTQDITNPVTEYSWVFGDGGISNLPNPVYVYTIPETYSVTLTVTGPGGSDSMTKTDYITVLEQHLPPNANFSATPLFGVVPLYVDFTNLSSGEINSLLWEFGDGETSTDINPSHEYQNAGLYTVSLTAYGPYGTDTETKVDYIEVIEPQAVIAAFDVSTTLGLAPLTIYFTNQSVGTVDSILWDFGDGENSIEENPIHTYIEADEYTVILTVYGPINTDTAEETITVVLSEPDIIFVEDVPYDQGGVVMLNWQASGYDGIIGTSITSYTIWEQNNSEWFALGSINAIQLPYYYFAAQTLYDSTATNGIIWAYFIITAHTSNPAIYYTSEVDSGYSVDNIAPSAPQGLEGYVAGNNAVLNWEPCPDEDFQYFAIYKSSQSGTYEEPFAYTINTEYIDENYSIDSLYYAVTAFDYSGNESDYSEELIIEVSIDDNQTDIPDQHSISQNYPNPFKNITSISFGLPESVNIKIEIFNIKGQKVKTLINKFVQSGNHEICWQGDDDSGNIVRPGLYFYKLNINGKTESVKKCLLIN